MKQIVMGNVKSRTSWFGAALASTGQLLEWAPGFVEQYLPVLLTLVPAEYGNTLTGLGAAVIALRNVTRAPIADKAGQAGFARASMLVALAITGMVAMTLQGCSSFTGTSATEKLVVQAATMKFIEASGDRAAKAARIAAAADQARIWLDTDGVTLADLQAAMAARIAAANLEPSDKLLASALVEVVAAELDKRIGEGILSPEKRATVNAVLAWVEQAASFY